MTAPESFEGIVLRRRAFAETSLMITWFSREQGLVTTVARGAGRAGSPFSGLDLYQTARVVCSAARRGARTAREAEVLTMRTGLGLDYARLTGAACFGGWIEKLLEPGHAEPEIFDLLTSALDWLDSRKPRREALERFEKRLATLLGLGSEEADLAERLAMAGHGRPAGREEFLRLTE